MSWLELARAVYRRDPRSKNYETPPGLGEQHLTNAELTGPQERVIRLRFALAPDPLTLEQVGRIIGISRERVRQMEEVAIRKLRKSVGEAE